MGHLINPTAMRIGWYSSWCDSWYSDFIYYPEFLHEVFRLRLYLNFVFYRTGFEKKALLFSHFELFYKYNYFVIRLFYYDGLLMSGIFAFESDLFNKYFKKNFYFFRKKGNNLIYRRHVRLFLGVFLSIFSFADFFFNHYMSSVGSFDEELSYIRDYRLVDRRSEPLNISRRTLRRKVEKEGRVMPNFMKYISKAHRRRRMRMIMNTYIRYNRTFYGSRRYRFMSLRKKVSIESREAARQEKNEQELKGLKEDERDKKKDEEKELNIYKLIKKWGSIEVAFSYFFVNLYSKKNDDMDLEDAERLYREAMGLYLVEHTVKKLLGHYAGPGYLNNLIGVFLYSKWYNNYSMWKYEFKFLVIFFFLFAKSWELLKRDKNILNKRRKFMFFNKIFMTASFLFFFRGYRFDVLVSYIKALAALLVPSVTQFKVGFFLLSNDSVTARLISIFIGKRLAQGHTVRQAVYPVLRDLYRVSLQAKISKRLYLSKRASWVSKGPMEGRKSILKYFIVKYMCYHKRLLSRNFKINGGWINFYVLVFLSFLYEQYGVEVEFGRNDKKFIREMEEKKRGGMVLGLSKKFFEKRLAFLFFFNYDFSVLDRDLSFVFNEIFYDSFLKGQYGNSVFFFYIVDDLFSHFNVIFYRSNFKLRFIQSFVIAYVFLKRLLRLSYWKYHYQWLLELNSLSKLRERIKYNRDTYELRSSLQGFKIHLRGRFSRKQRASSLWFVKGRVPLNTLSAPIDYSFYSIPLRNSLASVKVWLYKDRFYPKWFLRQF